MTYASVEMVPAETLLADGQGALRQRLYFHLLSLNNVDLSQVVESPPASIWRNSFPCSQMVEHRRWIAENAGALSRGSRDRCDYGAISSRRLSPTTRGLVACLQTTMV